MGVLGGAREDLRSVAKYEKGILFCILIQLVLMLGQFAVAAVLRVLVMITALIVSIAGALFIFLLAIKVYGTGLGSLLGILTLIPVIGLIVLLIVNGKATNILRQNGNGLRVGLLGARLSDI